MPPKEIVATPSNELLFYWLVTGQLWRLGIGEDPTWGTRPIDQVMLHATIHELANKIADEKVRHQVQSAAASGMANTTQAMAKAAGQR